MDLGFLVDWFGSLDVGELLIELAQFIFLFFAWKRKKVKKDNSTADNDKSGEDLLALAEYHEKAAEKIRSNLKKE